jgi:molybdopterin molybdotransferase
MVQLRDDCFAAGQARMKLADALRIVDGVGAAVDADMQPLRSARGRILAEDVIAPGDIPARDNAAVDGFAVRFQDLARGRETSLAVAGRAAAGHPLAELLPPGFAVRIFTGAPMPAGFDTVFMQEDCRVEHDRVVVPAGLSRGANRRLAGEDVAAGAIVLRSGVRLRAQDVGMAAALGRDMLKTYRPLRAAVFSTGDELCEPGRRCEPAQIYDANRHALVGLLEAAGAEVTDLGILKDRPADVCEGLRDAARDHDLIVTSGGMSVGEEDHVKAAVETLGVLHLWQLSIKPGRPVGLGRVAGVPFVGLPGNPVAMVLTFLRIARPLVLRLSGAADVAPEMYRVQAAFHHIKKVGRLEWLRVRLVAADAGPQAHRFPRQGSGILSSLVESDGLVELPEEVDAVEPGMEVDFLPFGGMV